MKTMLGLRYCANHGCTEPPSLISDWCSAHLNEDPDYDPETHSIKPGANSERVTNPTSSSTNVPVAVPAPETCYEEANRIVNGNRQHDYGKPEDSFASIADMWNGLLRGKLKEDERVTSRDVAMMMTALKLARESNRPKRDNVVDAYGYLILLERMA